MDFLNINSYNINTINNYIIALCFMKHGFAFCVVRRILLTMTYDPENYSHVNIKSYTINIHITIILKYTNIIKLIRY
jgi:hypothetical protein